MGVCIGIAGGSASGKSTLACGIASRLPGLVTILPIDCYYLDQAHLSPRDRAAVNYDAPEAVELPLLVQHVEALLAGNDVKAPEYDYCTHTRCPQPRMLAARPILIVEGLYALHYAALRELMDLRIFADAADDLRLARRLQRDIVSRGRQCEDVLRQYLQHVRPMYLRHIAPSRAHADIVAACGDRRNAEPAIGDIVAEIRRLAETRAAIPVE